MLIKSFSIFNSKFFQLIWVEVFLYSRKLCQSSTKSSLKVSISSSVFAGSHSAASFYYQWLRTACFLPCVAVMAHDPRHTTAVIIATNKIISFFIFPSFQKNQNTPLGYNNLKSVSLSIFFYICHCYIICYNITNSPPTCAAQYVI